MKSPGTPDQGSEEAAQRAIDALHDIDINALSFAQLKRLGSALADASRRVASVTSRLADSDALGDTVRVAIPTSPDR